VTQFFRTEADPDVLSDYIIALLENYNGPVDGGFVTTMTGKLEDFLSARSHLVYINVYKMALRYENVCCETSEALES
jgi:hypothetical protein